MQHNPKILHASPDCQPVDEPEHRRELGDRLRPGDVEPPVTLKSLQLRDAVEAAVDAAHEKMRNGKSAVILDHGDLVFMARFMRDGCSWDVSRLPADLELILHRGLYIEILAAGRELAESDETFWPRLEKLGPTPELLKEANVILGGHEFERALRERRRPQPARADAERRTCSRARQSRRAAPGRHQGSRRSSATRAGPSDDDGESEPPGLRLWRHPRWGSCSPNLLRVLLREAK